MGGLVNPNEEKATAGPIDVKFSPDGSELYIVDLGIVGSTHTGENPQPNARGLWKIVKT